MRFALKLKINQTFARYLMETPYYESIIFKSQATVLVFINQYNTSTILFNILILIPFKQKKMKKPIALLVATLAFTVCLLSSFTPAKMIVSPKKAMLRGVVTVTKNFTTSNGLPAVATLQYTSGQVYSSITVTIQGEGNVPLTSVSHSSGPIYADTFEGYKAGSYYEYFVDVLVTGNPTIGWQISDTSAEAVVI
jgi:hypothetical protein